MQIWTAIFQNALNGDLYRIRIESDPWARLCLHFILRNRYFWVKKLNKNSGRRRRPKIYGFDFIIQNFGLPHIHLSSSPENNGEHSWKGGTAGMISPDYCEIIGPLRGEPSESSQLGGDSPRYCLQGWQGCEGELGRGTGLERKIHTPLGFLENFQKVFGFGVLRVWKNWGEGWDRKKNGKTEEKLKKKTKIARSAKIFEFFCV